MNYKVAIFTFIVCAFPILGFAQQKVFDDIKKAILADSSKKNQSVPASNIAVQDPGSPPDAPVDTMKTKKPAKSSPASGSRMIAVNDPGSPADSSKTSPQRKPDDAPTQPKQSADPKN